MPEITATVQFITPEQNPDLHSGEYGAVISMPSEFAEQGNAYVAFVVKGAQTISPRQVYAAALGFVNFNREPERLRDYATAIQKAVDAAAA